MAAAHGKIWKRLTRAVAAALLVAVAIGAVPQGAGVRTDGSPRPIAGISVAHAINEASDLAGLNREARVTTTNSQSDKDTFFARAFKQLMFWIIQFFGWLTALLLDILVAVAQYNGFTSEPIVVKGWTIVRDVCNMFFVFAMLLIAFGTILRIQAYHYRSLLFRVVLMAVLMNLSKSIVGVLIDLSQVVLLSFVSGFKDMASGGLAQALGMDKILRLTPTNTSTGGIEAAQGIVGSGDGAIASASTLLVSFILAALIMGLIFITVLAITAQLIARLIKLWVLTIMAPIAFAGTLFKGLGSIAGKWWDELTKELVAGPTLAFFLWLVLAISAANNGEIFGAASSGAGSFNPLNLEAASAANLVNLFVTVGLLWAGLGAAKAGGGAAAAAAGFGLAKITGAGRGAAAWTGRKAKGAAVGMGKFAGRWTAQGLSKSGIQGRYEMAKEGIRESAAGKAVRFFGKEATEQRWAARKSLRRERVLQHMETAAESADLAGQPTGWIQSAKRKREQKWRVESNVAVSKNMKQLEEQGINDNASIRAELASNMKNGKVVDVDKQSALLRLLASKGKVLDANRDIIENTAGMSDSSRAALLASFKDHDTSSIKSDGGIRSGAEVMEEVESAMKGDADRGAKNKRVRGIAAKVRVDESGQPANSTAVAVLRNLDEDYIEPLDKKLKEDIKEAILLTVHNAGQSGDTKLRDEMVEKYNQLFAQGTDKNGNALPKLELDKLDGQVKDDAMRAVQQKAAGKQERDQIKEVRLKRDSLAPLDEGEQALQKLVAVIDDAPEKVEELRVKLAELSSIDTSTQGGRAQYTNIAQDIDRIQQQMMLDADSLTKDANGNRKAEFTYVDSAGKTIDPSALIERMFGGDLAARLDNMQNDVALGQASPEDAKKLADNSLQVVSARFNRIQKAAPPKGITSAGSPVGRARDTAYLAGAYVQPRQAVNKIADPLVSKAQVAVRQAYQQIEQTQRTQKLQPVLEEVREAIGKMLAIDRLDGVQKASLAEMASEAERLSSNINTASEAEVSALITKIGKLKNLA